MRDGTGGLVEELATFRERGIEDKDDRDPGSVPD
jgi:hypothetical protein